ncbi:hypothetical protein GALMADRAFT_151521 [Galerina marginata CBS 339.88]|uniref:Protein kinase domain-containing protein n=1 Tax=Galerina marginata (strain CBS 339.88) TaxID=685588 RepID=A0A067TGW6_GALM3|nr:hypothetical protein GALMADRAFT_151521 [Galerina marginata CBS 339.88]
MATPAPSITFSISDKTFDLVPERAAFWDSPITVQWFKERGYTLYKRFYLEGEPVDSQSVPALPFEEFGDGMYPFAYYDTKIFCKISVPLRSYVSTANIAFAQDSFGRHVAIKIVQDNTDEYRILRLLSQKTREELKDNCVIPVLELLPIEGFWFTIMPRWGTAVITPMFSEVRQVLHFIRSTLKALVFLHENNICHGDIKAGNILVNHFGDQGISHYFDMRYELRSRDCIHYAMFDFDFSIMLPPGIDRTKYRLPYHKSWGTFNTTMDTAQGEIDFNPFVLDVGSLGVMLSSYFRYFSGTLPLLAPLLDKMTTRNLHSRFTASEALHFLEDMYSQLTPAELSAEFLREADIDRDYLRYYEYDTWKHVPPEFAAKWAAYREPPIPWTTTILRKLCQNTWIYHIVLRVRWFLSRLSSCYRHTTRKNSWLDFGQAIQKYGLLEFQKNITLWSTAGTPLIISVLHIVIVF